VDSIRLLYVEDDPADRDLTQRHLARYAPHLTLQVAPTVGEALEQLARGGVDLVLSDYLLPDGTGLDLLEAIKVREWMMPVVLVTGSGDPEAAVRLLKAGAADYVVKRPGYLDTLPAVLDGAFRWSKSLRELRRTAVRVLYTEDDPADVELTRRAFREYGAHFELEVATRGREAIKRLRTTPYDLLILDHQMPDLSGIEVLKALREEQIRIPVVIVTGQGDEGTAVQAFKLGAADYVIKGEGYLTKLPSTLENVLAQARLADEKDALLVLSGLTRSIATLRDVDEVLPRVAQAAADLLRTDVGVLWLLEGTELRPAASVGLADSVVPALQFHADGPLLERAVSKRRVAITDLHPWGGGDSSTAVLGEAAQTLAVSLVTTGRVIGVLAVASRPPRGFNVAEERLLTILADHAATAIENVHLYQRLKDRLHELRRTQAQLIQAEKLAAMGQLLAGVAHELNNPLSVVMGQAALLGETTADAQVTMRAGKIAEAGERCARIVRNFLALARQRRPERRSLSLNNVVQKAVELLTYSLQVDNVEVTLDLEPGLPSLWADPDQLHQVLVNLVTNAHHAMRAVRSPGRVTVTTRSDAIRGRVCLDVADTGPGIPAEIQTRIFEPFFTTKPPGQGTGLGLSLCHAIVEGYGGTIRVESAPGQGTVFRIALPVEAPLGSGSGVSPAGPPPVRGKSILLVDDEPEVAATLAELLSIDGHRVDTAGNGVLALDRLREHTYDLIVSDLRMPGLDGPGFYHELKRQHPRFLARIVFLTGDTLSPELRAFLESTGVPSLNKPITMDETREMIRRLLSES